LEAGLLPGAMRRNAALRFRCEWVHVRVEHNRSPFTAACATGQVLRLPIAHGEGNYFAPPELLARLEARGQVLLRYCDASGAATAAANPNGSVANVAGLASEGGNVFALMPHPERASEPLLGGTDDFGHGLAGGMKVESHYHPSAVEPFQGAATGVGGILRDVFTMGARPVAMLDSLHFGPLGEARNRYLFEGVVAGIAHYGNCM